MQNQHKYGWCNRDFSGAGEISVDWEQIMSVCIWKLVTLCRYGSLFNESPSTNTGISRFSLPGVRQSADTYGPAGAPAAASPAAAKSPAAKAAAADEDEDDLDLFGSDDEETKAIKAKRVEEYAAKKAKSIFFL